jgi:hypothetical protein
MAENIVAKGHAREHVRVLEGLRVLEAGEERGGAQITINGFTLAGLPTPAAAPLLLSAVVKGGHDDRSASRELA